MPKNLENSIKSVVVKIQHINIYFVIINQFNIFLGINDI